MYHALLVALLPPYIHTKIRKSCLISRSAIHWRDISLALKSLSPIYKAIKVQYNSIGVRVLYRTTQSCKSRNTNLPHRESSPGGDSQTDEKVKLVRYGTSVLVSTLQTPNSTIQVSLILFPYGEPLPFIVESYCALVCWHASRVQLMIAESAMLIVYSRGERNGPRKGEEIVETQKLFPRSCPVALIP